MLTATRKSADAGTGEATEETAAADLIQAVDKKYGPQFADLEETAKSVADKLESFVGKKPEELSDDERETIKSLTKENEDLNEQVQELSQERDRELVNAQLATLSTTAKSLKDVVAAAREPHGDFDLSVPSPAEQDQAYGPGSDHSFFVDAKKSAEHDAAATERWTEAMAEKTMTQASGSVGGFLVPPQISAELLKFREQSNVLRPWFSSVQVDSDTLRIAAQTKGLLAGWVAELAEKPVSDLAFGEISVNVFWKAGMAIVSNQLLRNSNPSVDNLIYNDLGKRLAALEEIAFISGSGTGQPQGILSTPGVQYKGDGESGGATTLTSTDVDDLLDAIVDGITAIYTEYFGAPNAILMHPRTWGRIVKERATDGTFLVGPPTRGQGGGRDDTDPLPGFGAGPNPVGQLFGLPVITTRNVPTNAGAADNESRVIIGNFSEGLILDHAQVTLDASEHVYFSTNQTIFRAEDAVGFTAARYPKAFYVIGGTGLANG